MKIKIEVKQCHIWEGNQNDRYCCPIAKAVSEDLACYGNEVRVDKSNIKVNRKKYKMPRSVQRFIKKFDAKGSNFVKPFSFILKEIEK